MGNISSMARASTALDSYVAELGNDISYEKSMSSSRFLKTLLARHKNGPLVIKIFIKPDASMTLRVIQRRLKTEAEALAHIHNAYTYATFIETEKAGYLIRQWVGSSLYDRLSTQPYLTDIEKKWIAFQLLTCLRDARMRKVAHGDIKSDNVLITSDLTVLVTDFSSAFKPTFLPLDDPSDFSFFFDSSARRTCYIAPERFYEAGSKIAQDKAVSVAAAAAASLTSDSSSPASEPWEKRDGKVTEEMDVFSAGCVIAETWTDGRRVFDLSELYAYRNGSLGLEGILDSLEDQGVRDMIAHMLSREPSERPSFDHILATYRGTIFPEYFYTFLNDYVSELGELPDSLPAEDEFLARSSTLPGTKIDTMLDQWDSISVHLEGKGVNENGPALLLLNIVTSSIRICLSPSSRLHGLRLFLNLCPYLMDEDKVDRIVPFVVELLSDEVAIVRAEACRTLVIVVESVKSITLHNCTFIPEYLLPQTRRLTKDPDVFVRATYARALVRLADEAVRMLELSQAATPAPDASHMTEADYNSMLAEIHSVVEDQATALLVDPSSNVKRSLLASIQDLCLFFGRHKSSEVVLSHIMTYLNDRDWQLRLAFFDGIVDVGAFIGVKAVEEYVLPLMLQALADPEEAVVARVIASLSSLTTLSLLPRMRLWDVFFATQGFLYHPNAWIRQGTAGFIAAAARHLSTTDTWCIIYPAVRQALRADVETLDEDSILSALVPPLSRGALQIARSAALQNSPPGFWNTGVNRATAKSLLTKAASSKPVMEQQQLKDKGVSAKDERKILAMREFIAKQAHAIKAREGSDYGTPPDAALTSGKTISLGSLGVPLHTVFISPRTVGVNDARMGLRRLRADLADTPSRRASFASRSARGNDSPADELRRRLAALETTRRASIDHTEVRSPSPTESAISSRVDAPAGITPRGHRRSDSKSGATLGTVHATALGTTSIAEDAQSGQSTPVPAGATPQPAHAAAPYSSTYDGKDPGVREYLEQVDLENYREPLLDLGPRVHATHRKRGPRPKASTPQSVTMIAHFPNHTGPVTAIVPSPDQLFFATASEDRTIHIWDNARLERSVSGKPRLTYRMDAPIAAMCRIEETHCLAAAAEDGTLHVLRVYVSTGGGSTTKYRGIEGIRTWRCSPEDGYVMHVTHLQASSLLVVTSSGMIGVLDMRSMELKSRWQHPLELGPISAVCPTTHWIVVGTVTGSLSLWDLRFGMLLKSWAARGGITSLALHPVRGRGRWVMASLNRDDPEAMSSDIPLVETYDIETAKLVEVFEARNTRPSSRAPLPPSRDVLKTPSDLIAEIAGGRGGTPAGSADSTEAPSVDALLAGTSFAALTPSRVDDALKPGWLVTAGDDRVIRYWDLGRAADGFVMCGSPRDKDVVFKAAAATPSVYYTLPNVRAPGNAGGAAGTASVIGGGAPGAGGGAGAAGHLHAANSSRQPLRPHYDAICALAVVETPFSSCVVSADRSGVIKVWRMEGGAPVRT